MQRRRRGCATRRRRWLRGRPGGTVAALPTLSSSLTFSPSEWRRCCRLRPRRPSCPRSVRASQWPAWRGEPSGAWHAARPSGPAGCPTRCSCHEKRSLCFLRSFLTDLWFHVLNKF